MKQYFIQRKKKLRFSPHIIGAGVILKCHRFLKLCELEKKENVHF